MNEEGVHLNCPRCGRAYKFKHSLLTHLNNVCGGQRKFNCDICHRAFTQNVSLRRHLMRNHNIYRPPGLRGRKTKFS